MNLKEEIRDRIAEMLEIESEELGYDDLFAEHGMDSFTAMQLVVILESEYDVRIPDERIAELKTVSDTIRIIEELK
jgi:acyl carrier protein